MMDDDKSTQTDEKSTQINDLKDQLEVARAELVAIKVALAIGGPGSDPRIPVTGPKRRKALTPAEIRDALREKGAI